MHAYIRKFLGIVSHTNFFLNHHNTQRHVVGQRTLWQKELLTTYKRIYMSYLKRSNFKTWVKQFWQDIENNIPDASHMTCNGYLHPTSSQRPRCLPKLLKAQCWFPPALSGRECQFVYPLFPVDNVTHFPSVPMSVESIQYGTVWSYACISILLKMENGIELDLPDTCNLKFWSSSSHASSLQGWFRYGFIDFSKNLLTSKDLIF